MTLEGIYQGYALNDGQVISFIIGFPVDSTETLSGSIVSIALNVRKYIGEQQFEPCTIVLEFTQTVEVDICEDFRTQGSYTDIVLAQIDDGHFYLSLDPYSNSGQPSDNDNFVIKAKQLSIIDETGMKQIIS